MTAAGAPDYPEPLVGWRVWVVAAIDDAPRLRSVVQKTVWPTRRSFVAECRRRDPLARLFRRRVHETVPEPSCHCGIYATELPRLEPLLAEAPWDTAARVLGQVALWGDVVECERGWRAAEAYPARLFVPSPEGRRPPLAQATIADGLADYGVEVEVLDCRASQAVARVAQDVVSRRRRSSAA